MYAPYYKMRLDLTEKHQSLKLVLQGIEKLRI